MRPIISLLLLTACASPQAPADPGLQVQESTKPVASGGMVASAQPQLNQYLQRVLQGREVMGREIQRVELVDARLFTEGHVNEAWYLAVEADGELMDFALKIFGEAGKGDANAAQYRAAMAHNWPIPREIVRGPASPYSDRPSLLMEFITGGSLRRHVERQFEGGGLGDIDTIANAYAAVASELGRLHRENHRERTPKDRSGKQEMLELVDVCTKQGWCSDAVAKRFRSMAEIMDVGPVTFIHGDLYESQVILTYTGQVAAFIDMDMAGFGHPATDVGAVLAHIMLFNPHARNAKWHVPNPTGLETRTTAKAFLEAYREAATPGDTWPAMVQRIRAYMWLRFGQVYVRFKKNVHAKPLIAILDQHLEELLSQDPFADLEVEL